MIRTLFLKSSFILLFCLTGYFVQAAYLKNISIRITQPNGAMLTVFATGDEYYNWIHDANNFTIVKDPSTGYYVYASLQDGELIPTSNIVGISDPVSAGLIPGVNIPAWKMELKREEFLAATPAKPSILPPSAPLVPDVSGTVNNIVVFIRFSDQSEFTDPISFYDNLFNNSTAGANSMYNYFKDVSYNTTFVPSTYYPLPNGTLVVSYQDDHTRNYYCPYDAATNPEGYTDGQRTSREHTLLKNAVNAISSQVPAGLNVDYNNDGYVDNVCFIIKGTTTAWSTLLWPHRWSLYSQTCYINSKQVWDYNLQLETFMAGSGVGVLAHEMTHTFGCPDLYHYNGDGFSPVGPWDLMEANANPPQHIGAFMKYKYTSWISSIPLITTAGTYTLNPLASPTNNAYKMASPNSSTEFFIFEYRKKTGTFEGSVPASGLLIYRINTLAGNGNAGGPPDEIYLYRPGGTPSSNGDVYNGYFSSNVGRTTFTDSSNPYAFLSDGTLGGINISDITATDATISFTVNMGTVADFTANLTNTCTNSTVTFTDQTFGGPTSWTWSITPSTYSFVNGTTSASQNPQVQFSVAGNYTVTLVANGPNGSSTKTKTDFIHILSSSAIPFTETFETGLFTTNSWSINNPDASTTWEMYSGAGGNGASTKSAYINFYNYSSYPVYDDLISKPFTLTAGASSQLIFKVAYRQYDATYHDSLKVLISTDCGATFGSTVYSKGDAVLATGAATTTAFVPTVAGDWRTDTVNLSNFQGQSITVKFRGINGYGNNLFIDDINIIGGTGLTANFTGTPTTLCQGGSVQFTDLSTGSPTTWMWNFGDGTFSSLQNPSHIYNTAGVYSVTLSITKPGSSHSITKTNYITVNALQTVGVTISQTPSGSICVNSSVTFNASVTNGGTTPVYQWKKNNANVGTNSSSYTVSGLVNGDNISCVVTSNVICPANNPAVSNVITVTVVQNVIPSVSIAASPSNVICSGTSVSFTATPVNGGASPVYQWKKNGSNVGTNSSTFTTSSLVSSDVITCVMTSSSSCVTNNPATSNSIVMTVNSNVTAGVSIAANPSGTICAGTNVVFTATPVNGGATPVYQWKKNGNNVGINSTTYSNNALVQGDVITCQMTSNATCATNNPATSNTINMTVTTPVAVGVTISASPSNTICAGTQVVFSAVVSNGGTTPVYNWKRNNVTVSTSATYTSSNLANGDIISCQLTSNATCITGNPATSNAITMTVTPTVAATISISQLPSGSVCAGTPITFTPTITNGGDSPIYQWKKNNVVVSTDPIFTTSTLANGDIIKCTLTSSATCITSNPVNSNTLTVSILPSYTVGVSIVASPPGAVCVGNPVTFIATAVNGGLTPAYEWFVDGVSAATGSSFTSSSLINGSAVNCVLTSSYSTCVTNNPAVSDIIFANIQPLPVVNLGNDTIIANATTLTLDAGAGFASYFWNTGAMTQTIDVTSSGDYSVTVTDNADCSGTDAINVIVGYSVLQGNLTYLNSLASPMNNSTVTLKQGTTVITSTNTDSQGHFFFEGLAPGSYKIVPSSTKPWGGVNSTDALLIMKHFVGMSYLTGLKLKAGNVDNFSAVNSVDALLVQQRTVSLITSFPQGDWTFENPTITITGLAPVTQNVKALTVGDVNASYTPAAKNNNSIELKESPIQIGSSQQKIDIPLYCGSNLNAGAMTLYIKYPYNSLKLTGISMNQDINKHLVYSENNGLISISWADVNAMNLVVGDEILKLHFNQISTLNEGYQLSLDNNGEIADAMGIPYETVSLYQPYVSGQIVNSSENISVYPNPFQDNTSIIISLSNNSNVSLGIFNSQGQFVRNLGNTYYLSGKHEIDWNGNDDLGNKLPSGVYYIRMLTAEQSKIVTVVRLQ